MKRVVARNKPASAVQIRILPANLTQILDETDTSFSAKPNLATNKLEIDYAKLYWN